MSAGGGQNCLWGQPKPFRNASSERAIRPGNCALDWVGEPVAVRRLLQHVRPDRGAGDGRSAQRPHEDAYSYDMHRHAQPGRAGGAGVRPAVAVRSARRTTACSGSASSLDLGVTRFMMAGTTPDPNHPYAAPQRALRVRGGAAAEVAPSYARSRCCLKAIPGKLARLRTPQRSLLVLTSRRGHGESAVESLHGPWWACGVAQVPRPCRPPLSSTLCLP